MNHKKKKHPETVLMCADLLKGQCSRSSSFCWFRHDPNPGLNNDTSTISHMQGFQMAPQAPFPPDQMSQILQQIKSLCMKVEKIDQKVEKMEQKFQGMKLKM